MTVADSELRLDRQAAWAVHDALCLPVGGTREFGAHLWCGAGHAAGNWAGQRSCIWTSVDEDELLIGQAKARDFASRNYNGSFFENGGLPSQVSAPLRGDATFRRERVTRTSIKSASVDRVVLNWGLRGACEDARGVGEEICRIAKPGAPVVLIHYHELRIDDWCIDDVLRPLLVDARRRWRRPSAAFAIFRPTPIQPHETIYAVAKFNLADVIAHIEARPECQRLLATHGWPGTGYLFRHLKKHWGRHTIKRNVRCRVSIYAGSVPPSVSEHSPKAPRGGA